MAGERYPYELSAGYGLLIAACALDGSSTLVTNNERHFRKIKRLKIDNWTLKS